MELVYKHEKKLFMISAIISGIIWLLLIIGTVGIALIYLLLVYILFLFVHSAFISHLKGTGVKLSEQQFPDLYEKFINNCEKVGINEIPDAYLLRMDFFNALATRFLRKNYLVLFTDVVDALKTKPNAIDFYIGHELGHIHRNHLKWNAFIAPASIFPLLGAALRRSEEYTCDRYGAFCCKEEDDVKAAIAAIAAGDTHWDSINVNAYIDQSKNTSEFWMSYNELTGDYPWLTKRMAASIAFKRRGHVSHPRRHFFAWLLAAITPRFGAGGGLVSLMVTIAIIGILAAVALPAYQDYTFRAQYTAAYSAGLDVQNITSEYVLTNQEFPTSLTDLGLDPSVINDSEIGYVIDIYEGGIIGIQVGTDNAGEGQYIVIEPVISEDALNWTCYGQNVNTLYLPPECQ